MQRRLQHWWSRRCGGASVMALALPLVLSTASWTIMHFIDRVFLTWHSTEAIAAAMPAGMTHFAAICLPLGIAGYANTFVAQYFGAHQPRRIGALVWQGIHLGLLSVPVYLATISFAPNFFDWVGHPVVVRQYEVDYFQSMAYGAGAAVIAAAMASLFTGIGQTRVVMAVDIAASALNVLLDYLLIFGYAGLPELGIVGAGIATSIAQWSKVLAYALIMALPAYRQPYALFENCRFQPRLAYQLLRYGGPSGLQVLIEVVAFTLVSFQMGRLGEVALAATTIAFSINAIAFVPMLGLGIAVSTMVGQQLGAGRPRMAERATWTSLTIGAVYTTVIGAWYLIFPDAFLMAHAAGSSEDFQQLRQTCYHLLRFVAAYCVLDMVQIVFASAIKGAGDTRFVLSATVAVSPVPVILAWWGVEHWQWGLSALWWVVTIWIWALGAIYFARFHFGPWRGMRVIDSPVPVEKAAAAECV